jgi:hypothetical protein
MDTANHGALSPEEHTRSTDAEDAGSLVRLGADAGMPLTPILHSRQFLAFVKHRNLQEGS